MNCLKCGRETNSEHIFCDACLKDMENHPVKPGTVVRLPKRAEPSPFRKMQKRRGPNADEQIKALKLRIRFLRFALAFALLVIGAMSFLVYEHLSEEKLLPGQNYSTITPSATSSSAGN